MQNALIVNFTDNIDWYVAIHYKTNPENTDTHTYLCVCIGLDLLYKHSCIMHLHVYISLNMFFTVSTFERMCMCECVYWIQLVLLSITQRFSPKTREYDNYFNKVGYLQVLLN